MAVRDNFRLILNYQTIITPYIIKLSLDIKNDLSVRSERRIFHGIRSNMEWKIRV